MLDGLDSSWLTINIGVVYGNYWGCQHPSEADHQLWVAKATLPSMKVWKDANERLISKCNLSSAKRGDSKKRMKSCVPKCHHRAPLKVGNPNASEQPQDELMKRHSLGTQSSPLAVTQHNLRRSFHQLVRCSWMKASTLLKYQQRGVATEGHIYQMRSKPDWDLRRQV